MTKLASWINTFEEGTVQKTILIAIYLIPFGGIAFFGQFIYSRLLDKDKIHEKREKISSRIKEV
jgi:alpha-glucuronidase